VPQQQHCSQITHISKLQFRGLREFRNFMHIISMQSSEAAITLSGSGLGRICWQISSHIRFRWHFKILNPVHP